MTARAGAVESSGARRRWLVCAALAACTFVVYSPLRHAAFVGYDDPLYVTQNDEVRRGLTRGGIAWAFTTYDIAMWHPLTWLSHMAMVSVAGLDAGWHHLANVALHAASAIVLLLVLERATGALWPSALVAFLFALHPLHVESVAWVAERKDVLSTLFGFLAIDAYVRWTRDRRRGRYLLATLWLALSLLAKPTLVTLPALLLVLDYWPLRRFPAANDAAWARKVIALLIEKAPLGVLAAAAAVVAVIAQRHGGSVTSVDALPIAHRLGHAVNSVVTYLGQALWPSRLAVFYPYPHVIDGRHVAAAGALLVAITAAAAASARRAPFVLVGWLWFLVSLLPVIGIVQIGMQARADRYMYVPLVGLGIMLAWTLAEVARRAPGARIAAGTLAVLTVAGCTAITARQVGFWMNDVTLFEHALAVTSDNFLAHNNLGLALVSGTAVERARAAEHFAEALRLRPAYPEAHNNLGGLLYLQGRRAEAIAHFTEALRLRPNFTAARNNLRVAQTAPPGSAPP